MIEMEMDERRFTLSPADWNTPSIVDEQADSEGLGGDLAKCDDLQESHSRPFVTRSSRTVRNRFTRPTGVNFCLFHHYKLIDIILNEGDPRIPRPAQHFKFDGTLC